MITDARLFLKSGLSNSTSQPSQDGHGMDVRFEHILQITAMMITINTIAIPAENTNDILISTLVLVRALFWKLTNNQSGWIGDWFIVLILRIKDFRYLSPLARGLGVPGSTEYSHSSGRSSFAPDATRMLLARSARDTHHDESLIQFVLKF